MGNGYRLALAADNDFRASVHDSDADLMAHILWLMEHGASDVAVRQLQDERDRKRAAADRHREYAIELREQHKQDALAVSEVEVF